MTRTACVVVATERRRKQVYGNVLPSTLAQFDDVIVVGDWPDERSSTAYRYFCVAPLTRTTNDALVKRDVGTLVTDADVIVYLCDDHRLHTGFSAALRAVLDEPWDVIVPNRFTMHNGVRIPLNNGERAGYCGGHAGVFRRHVVTSCPWSAQQHHRNWDAISSQQQRAAGARFVWSPRADLSIIDLEPQAQPWQ